MLADLQHPVLQNLNVNLKDRWEVQYWMRTFECTEAALRDAVAKVGTVVSDLRRELSNKT